MHKDGVGRLECWISRVFARALSASFTGRGSTCVHSYTYLRGIDGKLPSDEKLEKEPRAPNENNSSQNKNSTRPTDATEGLNQADDLRRLAVMLFKLDSDLRKNQCKGL